MKISKIKELFFQHFRASKKSVAHRTPRTLQRVKKAIKYFWDLKEYNDRISGLPNESNLDEIYINIKIVFLARYKKSIDSNTVNDDLMKKECKYINVLTNFLYYFNEQENFRNRDRWKIGTEYEPEYVKKINDKLEELKRYENMVWIYELTGYRVGGNNRDYLILIAKDVELYSYGKEFFENEESKTLLPRQVAEKLLEIYGKEVDKYSDNAKYGLILRKLKLTAENCEKWLSTSDCNALEDKDEN